MGFFDISTSLLLVLISSCVVQAAGCAGDLKVASQGDLDALRSCQKYQGTITVERLGVNRIQLAGIETLSGDLIIKDNDALVSLDLGGLKLVDGTIRLENNKIMSKFDAKSLTGVRSFEMAVHPALSALAFPSGLEQADRFSVSDTTVTRIDGFKADRVSELVIDNNIYLKSIGLENMTEVTGSLKVSANSPSLNLDLKGMKNVKDASFRNLAGIALDSLKQVSGDISFISNTFGELALPETTEIAGTLTITSNTQLAKLGLPKIKRLGGALSLGNNNNLATIDSFPNLEEVDGTLDISGTFDEVQLPKLSDVRGGLNNGVIKGNSFQCKAAVAKPKSGTAGGKTGSGSSADSDASDAVSLKWGASFFAGLAVVATVALL
ncbi:hypothetical protein BX666DRAFT_2020201 [Dichotomocladium elegans]|nr:hypothetical protein BX666DRAFT_2020201 [Dichotomocladium elegans]